MQNSTDINIKEEIINYLSKYNIDVKKNNDSSEYLSIQDKEFKVTFYSNKST